MTTKEGTAKETGGSGFNFKNCEQMMRQFCGGKDGKLDFEKFCGKMAEYFKEKNKEPNDTANE